VTQPVPYEREQDFTQYQDFNAEGTELNRELDNVAITISQLRTNINLLQRDDGQLENAIVSLDQLEDMLSSAIFEKDSSVGFSNLTKYRYVATEGQLLFDGVDADGSDSLEINLGIELVSLNGSFLVYDTDYTASTSSLTLSSTSYPNGAEADDEIKIYAFVNAYLASHYTRAQVEGLFATLTEVGSLTETVEANEENITENLNAFYSKTLLNAGQLDTRYYTESEVDALLTANQTSTLLAAYPINSLYISFSSTNPNEYFGGTWLACGQGRVLIGAGESTGDDQVIVATSIVSDSQYEIKSVGNSDFTTFGSENNVVGTVFTATGAGSGTGTVSSVQTFLAADTGGEFNHTLTEAEMPEHQHTVSHTTVADRLYGGTDANRTRTDITGSASNETTSSTGSGTAHNNLQPYLVTYFFKRLS